MMTIRRLRDKFAFRSPVDSSSEPSKTREAHGKRKAFRKSLIETLESRQLLAVGPRLIGVQPNNSDLIENGVIRHISPRELTFRFDDVQIIDAATTGGIRVSRAGGDGTFSLPSISSDLGTNGAVDFQFTSKNAADLLVMQFTTANLGSATTPTMSINGNTVSIVLNSNPASQVTAAGLVQAINNSAVLSPRLSAKINGGLSTTRLGTANPAGYSPVVMRSSNDVIVQAGSIVIGDRPNENEVTLRFAENLPDDVYRLEIFGFDDESKGIRGLRNTDGELFVPSVPNTRQDTIEFRLDLGARITGVVPQPVVRNSSGQLTQERDTIVVYFDHDKLLVENDASGNPTPRSVENPEFYQLIYTSDTIRNTDDLPPFLPISVRYNASANTATLKFSSDIDLLAGPNAPSSSYRLRVGTRESAPIAPVASEAAATAIIDMNSSGAAKVRFTSKILGEAGSGTQVRFVNSGSGAAAPAVTVAGRIITVDLASQTTTVSQVINAIESHPEASILVRTTLEPGSNGSFIVGNRPINYSATLYGLGGTFDTATDLGTIGSSAVPMTSLILTSNIDAQLHELDLLGAANDPGQRVVPQPFENHINPAFGGDDFAGIRTIYYNFRSNYGVSGGTNLVNAITEKQKERVREALSLWTSHLGVQFVETTNAGVTFALGELSAANQAGFSTRGTSTFNVRMDPTYNNSLAVFSASNAWEDNYGEDFTRSAAASIGLILGLSNAGNLDASSLMNFDSGFINFPPAGSDRNFEPVFPGNQDVLHGQYIHRPEGSDIDLYRFEIDFGADGANREGVLVAETFAERSANSSSLDTRLALYKETQATATTSLNLGQSVQVEFTAVQPGKLGNNLQVFVTRSPRGAGAAPQIQVFPNAITIDINSTPGSETTLGEFVSALNDNLSVRSLVKVQLKAGNAGTVLGSRDITYSPITLQGGRVDLISQNDDYFSSDSLIRMNLDSGVYYIGVSASGNDQYDPVIPNSGYGGRTQGRYDLRVTFRAQTDASDSIQDIAEIGGVSVPLDGDGDGVPGGVFNFWFETRQLDRAFQFNAGGSAAIEGRTITVTGANGTVRRFEFSSDATVGTGNTRIPYTNSSTEAQLASAVAAAINSRTELGVTASAAGRRVTIRGERTIQFSADLGIIDVMGKTIFVDKTAGPAADGSLAKPFNNIAGVGVPNAFGVTYPGDIVRIVGNAGADGKMETVEDNLAYEIGYGLLSGAVLSDGPTMDVPQGVTVMIDAGAIFKSNRSRIGVGSSTLGVDRSGGALQVLGAPVLLDNRGNAIKLADGSHAPGSVYFTSWLDESIGLDNYTPSTTPSPGNWGGLVFKRDLDKAAGRFDLEDEGIFLQYVNHADIRYGGSSAVVIDSIQQVVNSVQIADMRPTITNNKISYSADAAVSATPDSFLETLFSEPIYQRKGAFTPDYDRVGPNISNNILFQNSINGLFIKVSTPVGGETRQLTVPGRFDDTDITHVISENVVIQGRPGAGLLDSTSVSSNLVSLQARTGGDLTPGTYNYKIAFVDRNGFETPPSAPTQNVVLSPGQSAVNLFGLPGVSGEYVTRRIYRSDSTGGGSYRLVAELDGGNASFVDRGVAIVDASATLLRDRPTVTGVGLATLAGGDLPASRSFVYRVVMVDAMGRESLASNSTNAISTTSTNQTIRLTNLPGLQDGYATRRIYRSEAGQPFVLVGELTSGTVNTFVDAGGFLGASRQFLSVETSGNIRPRLDASLTIDPGTVVKLEGARIEIGHSAQLLAEGTVNGRVVFTSKQDDRFGAGGTFDTNNNGNNHSNDANPRDWSGIYASPGSRLHLDNAIVAFAGGVSRIEGTLKAFSPVELQQANGRIANTVFEENANGIGGQGPIDRLGRPANENYPLGNNQSRGSTVFIRGAQPIFLNNVFQNNQGTAITIDANSMDSTLRGDIGRQTGAIDRNLTQDANRGPLFRGNRLFNNGINGLEVRGDAATNNRDSNIPTIRDIARNVLTTESVWDDTDIVHVLFDSIVVSNLEHGNGLRLQSAINESLVIKLDGQASEFDKERGTGFTATGRFSNSAERVGGTIQVIGQPGFPVVFTSLKDDTVGAGTQPDGRPQTDTNNDGLGSTPKSGDWRSLLFDSYSNDRNVLTVMEIESPTTSAPGTNDNVTMAQFIGHLAPNAQSSDDARRLGYIVQGVISEPNDQDVYSMTATAGTEVWFDVDSTSHSLDTVIEILDASGALLARSDDSTAEQLNPDLLEVSPLIDRNSVNPLVKRSEDVARKHESGLVKDDYTTNPRDAGLRIRLPGIAGTLSTYFFRIRSKSVDIDNSAAGLTEGSYSVQVRLRDDQEFAGSIVSFADIRYATNGVHTTGLPSRSPLTGEAHVNMYDGVNDGITNVGNLHYTDLGAISVAGEMSGNANRIRFSLGDERLLGGDNGATYPIVIDVDYADGLNRPDTTAYLFTNGGVYVGADSNIADDLVNPVRPLSGSEFADLSRGSVGKRDPFIGTIALPRGEYDLVIAGQYSQLTGQARNSVIYNDNLDGATTFFDAAQLTSRLTSNADFKWTTKTSDANGAHSGTGVIGWDPAVGKPNTSGSPGVLTSRSFTLPSNSTYNDRVLFSMRYRYLAAPTEEVVVRVYNSANGGAPVFQGRLESAGSDWQMFGADLTAELMASPNASYFFEFAYRDAAGNLVAAAEGVEFDDFFLGTSATPISPINTYQRAVDETFDTGLVSTARNPQIFSGLPLESGNNQWQISQVGTNVGQSGTNVLEYRSDGTSGTTRLMSETIDLTTESGSSKLYFSYDFQPRGTSDRFDLYANVVGGARTLVASTQSGAAPVTLQATNGNYAQSSFSIAQLDGELVQLEFVYTSNGTPDGGASYVRIDNLMIGMASRGEYIAGVSDPGSVTGLGGSGQYQVEIRRSDDLPVGREFDSYDRGSVSTSLHILPGIVIPDKSVFTLSDGVSRVNFQFTYDGSFDFGNSPVRVSATSTPAEVAVAVREAINTMYSQSRLRITAANSNGVVEGTARQNSLLVLSGEVNFTRGAELFSKDGQSGVLNFNRFGDQNVKREQGQFVVTSTTVSHARDFGVWAAPADKYYANGLTLNSPNTIGPAPHLGGAYARNLPQENLVGFGVTANSVAENAGVAPGMVVTNNIFDRNGLGGLHIQGETPLWRITAFPGVDDNDPTKNVPADPSHSGTYHHDTDTMTIDFGRQRVTFEFEDLAGAPNAAPAWGSGVNGGNGWNQNNIPIFYREDGGAAPYGYTDDQMVRTIRESINGSVLVSNATSLHMWTWIDTPAGDSASLLVRGPQNITYLDRFGGRGPLRFEQLGEFTAAPYVRAVNNTVFGNDGRAPFNASKEDLETNDTIAGAVETWQGIASNPFEYSINATLDPDPLSTGSSDVDIYKFTLGVGDRVLIDIDTADGASLDAAVKIFDAQGRAMRVGDVDNPFTNEVGLAPGETEAGRDPYVDFTATAPGVYYAAVSSTGNTTYDPLSKAGRKRGLTSGDYSMTLRVLKPQDFVITVDRPDSYSIGSTFVIDQIPDVAGTRSPSVTFEFTGPGVTQRLPNGNYPVAIPAGHNVGAMAREIAAAINRANIRNLQQLDNAGFSNANPIPAVSAVAVGSTGGYLPAAAVQKYVVVRNASTIRGSGSIKVDPEYDGANNLNQIISETGILVSGGGTPTLLNNVFVNVQTPIVQEEIPIGSGGTQRPFRPSPTVVAGTVSQYHEPGSSRASLGVGVESGPINIPNTSLDFNIVLPNGVQAFVDAAGGRFLPAKGSPLIDSSIDSMPERETFRAVKEAIGIGPSPVMAPDRDHSGQLRADDPTVAPPSGLGGNVFKDRGALDRADFVGPTAVSITPIDNDAQGNDMDSTESVMRLKGGTYAEFRIQLKDGFETANLQAGTGIDDNSVVGREGGNRLPGSVITLTENGRLLTEGIDYVFSYSSTTNEIVLKPLAGIWKNDRVYDISLNNKDRFVIDAPAGDMVNDGDMIVMQDSQGGLVYFEYDSGFRLQLPQGIELVLPLAGGGAGGITDGDTFVVNNLTESFTFEFDSNNNSIAGNIRIPFSSLSTKLEIAQGVTLALESVPGLFGQILDNGNVYIGAPLGSYVDTNDAPSISQPNSTLALLIPSLATRPGGINDGQTFGITDGRNSFVFEFDTDRNSAASNTLVDISSASTTTDIANAIVAAINQSGIGISATVVGADKVHLSLPAAGLVEILSSNLKKVGVSRNIVEGESIAITHQTSSGSSVSVFEFTTDGDIAAGNIPVFIAAEDTQSEIGEKLAQAILNANIGLQPRHLGDGNIFIGGDKSYILSVANAPTVGLFGRPGIQDNTTLSISGTLLLQLPVQGGSALTDNSTFRITTNSGSAVFEFDSNFSGPSIPGNRVIQYSSSSSLTDLMTLVLPQIQNAGLGLTPRDAGGGRIDLGLLPVSAVGLNNSGLELASGNANDGDYFVIDNGTVSVAFEFENLSVGNGRNPERTPIRYNNSSTREDVYAAMKAAIESSVLGVQTVVTTDGLRLLDNARFTTNVDNANSLRLSGVPGGAIAIDFIQDPSFTSQNMRDAIVRAVNKANKDGGTTLTAKVRGGSTLFVENAVSVSEDVTNFYLRGIQDQSGNFLRSNRINNETQFTILMPGTLLDFGDAPDPVSTTPGRYPTLLSSDGARHVSNATGLRLGSEIDSEMDGRSSPLADGDAGDDGVTFSFQGQPLPLFNHAVETEVTITLSMAGFVDAWIDFNGDGDWDDPGEQILRHEEFSSNELTRTFRVKVPSTFPIPAAGLESYARFRASSAGNTRPTGLALDGEVEDYLVRILPGVPPTGVPDTYQVDEDSATGIVTTDATGTGTPGFTSDDGVLANDANTSGYPVSARLIRGPEHARSGFSLSPNGLFTYVPEADFYGVDTFVYRTYITVDPVSGEFIESPVDTTVTINVRPVNDPPVANNVNYELDEDETLSISTDDLIQLAAGRPGPANESDQVLVLSVPNNVSDRGGSVSVVGGELVYTPRSKYTGVDTFEFTLTDNGLTGTLSDPKSVTRTMTVTIFDTNDAPVTTPKNVTTPEDVPYSNTVAFIIGGDHGGEPGQTVTLTRVDPQSVQGGTVVIDAGRVIYTPRQDFNGADTFYYFVTDNDPTEPRTSRGTVNVNVTAVNDAPRVVEALGTLSFVEDDPEKTIDLTRHFTDPDIVTNGDSLTYRVVSNSNPNLVQINFIRDAMHVRPRADANGDATIVVEARDSTGASVTSTLRVVVSAVDDAPRLVSPMPNLNVREDDVIPPIVLTPNHFFDPDVSLNGDVLTFTVDVSNPDLVSAEIVNGQLRLTLLPDASGTSTITVDAKDRAGNTVSDSFDLVVASVNDGPRAVDDVYYVQPGTPFTTTDPTGNATDIDNDNGVLANDSDPEGNTFTARLTRPATHGTVTLNPDGTFTYLANRSVPVGTVDTFEYEGVDQFGAVGTKGTVTINVGNPAPPSHQNPLNRLDVNDDGFISPLDALIVVNYLNFYRNPSAPVSELAAPPPYMDVNGDNFISPLDVLEIVNYLNARSNQHGEGESAVARGKASVDATTVSAAMSSSTLVGLDSDNSNATQFTTQFLRDDTNAEHALDQPVERRSIESSQAGVDGDVFAYYLGDVDEDGQEDLLALWAKSDTDDASEATDQVFADIFNK